MINNVALIEHRKNFKVLGDASIFLRENINDLDIKPAWGLYFL